MIVVRAHHYAPAEDDWRVARARRRRARRARRGARLDRRVDDTRRRRAGQVVVLAPAADEAAARRTAEAVARELQAALHGFTFAVGHSRVAHDPVDLYRAGNEALLAANVAEAGRPAARAASPGSAGARLRGDRRLPAAAARR